MPTIQIKKLAVDTTIGVYEFEKKIIQRLYISLIIEHDFSAAMKSDKLIDTLDYALITQDIKERLENSAFELIERVLGVIAELLENRYHIKDYCIEVAKPTALEAAQTVSVTFDNRNRK